MLHCGQFGLVASMARQERSVTIGSGLFRQAWKAGKEGVSNG